MKNDIGKYFNQNNAFQKLLRSYIFDNFLKLGSKFAIRNLTSYDEIQLINRKAFLS